MTMDGNIGLSIGKKGNNGNTPKIVDNKSNKTVTK